MTLEEEFRAFQRQLGAAATPRWYCFFGPGLLHVARHFCRFVPRTLNLVFIVSALSDDEAACMRGFVDRPVFATAERVDPTVVYELLFRNCAEPFGWVDVDCFVMNESWYRDCELQLTDGVAMSGPLALGPIPILATPFLFYSPEAIARTAERIGGPTSASTYAYVPTDHGRDVRGFLSRLVEPHHDAALRRVIAMEADQLPYPQSGIRDILHDGREVSSLERACHQAEGWGVDYVMFDLLVLYQLVTLGAGLRLARTRGYTGAKVLNAEAVHTGRISYWQTSNEDLLPGGGSIGWARWVAYVDALLLRAFVRERPVPVAYEEGLLELEARLRAGGSSIDLACEALAVKLRAAGVDRRDPRWLKALEAGAHA